MSVLLIKIWRVLSSRNVAIVLLVVVTALLLIGSVLPNPNYMSEEEIIKLKSDSPITYFLAEKFNTQSMAKGYFFGFVGVFLIISTTACSIDRLIEYRRIKRLPLEGLPIEKYDFSVSVHDTDEFLKKLKNTLRLRRWIIKETTAGKKHIVGAEKGRAGFWGSILFHAILITVLFGLVIYYFVGFYGTILFTEGQTKLLSEKSLERIYRRPILGVRLPRLKMTLDHFYSVYWKDTEPVDYTAKFYITDLDSNKRWEQVIKINEPFRYRGIDFLMVLYGFSPNFIVFNSDGTRVFDAYVALSVVEGREDSFYVPEEGLTFKCIFFPDFRADKKGYYSATPLLRNPVFLVNILKNGKSLYKGLIALGEEKQVGPYRVRLNDVRYWITLNLVKETGIGFFFWSSLIGLVGLLIRFLDPDRKLFFVVEGDRLSVFSHSKHFEGILKEQTEQMIRELIKKGGQGVKA